MFWTKVISKARSNSGKKRIQKQFLVLIFLVAISIIGYQSWKFGISWEGSIKPLLIVLGLAFLLYLMPIVLKPVLFIWLLLGLLLGEITSTLILGLVYYFLFFPITFILRRTRKKKPFEPGWFHRTDTSIDYEKLY